MSKTVNVTMQDVINEEESESRIIE